jgi:hypothetical protein
MINWLLLAAASCAKQGAGGGGPVYAVNITNRTIDSEDVASPCTAGYRLQSSGQAQETNLTETYVNILGEWETGGAAGNLYEVFCTENSGSVTGSLTGQWLSLGTTRTWEVTQSVTGVNTANITVQIRRADTQAVLDTATHDITATVST